MTEQPAAKNAFLEWVVVRTRPRCEKAVERFCRTERIETFLPLLHRTHRYGGRVRTFSSPLFPGYVFALLRPERLDQLRGQANVARLLRTDDQAGLARQIGSIRQALTTNEVVEVLPYLTEGRTVVVTSGPMKGVEGVVVRLKNKSRVIVNVEMIQQAVAFEFASQDLGPG